MTTEVVDMITVVIDGFEVTVPKGTLVIRAAEQLGIQIPRFCDHPLLNPVGACRQCLVEIEINGRKFPKPQASCTIPVEPGMIVNTQLTSPVADKAQQAPSSPPSNISVRNIWSTYVMVVAHLILQSQLSLQPLKQVRAK